MNKKIVIALLTAIVLVVGLVVLMGCQTPATISINNEGALVTLEVGAKVAAPITITGELTDSQTINYTIIQSDNVIRFDKDTLEVEGVKEGYAVMKIELDGVVLIAQFVVNDTATAKEYTDALAAAQTQIDEYPMPDAVKEYEEEEFVAELLADYNAFKAQSALLLKLATNKTDIENLLDVIIGNIENYNQLLSAKIEALGILYDADFSADSEYYEGLDADLLNVALSAPEYQDYTNKTNGKFYSVFKELIKNAESLSDVSLAIGEITHSYLNVVNDVYVDVMLEKIGIEYENKDADIIKDLEEIEAKLEDTDKELSKQINNAIETIKLMQSVGALNVAGGTDVYDGTYHTFPNLTDCTIEYMVGNDETWYPLGQGIKDAGNYTTKVTKKVAIEYDDETFEIECVAYGSLTIQKATLPTPIWPTVDANGFVIYTLLKDIPLIGGLPGEGSPYDDEHINGGRVNGIFRWCNEEREIDPVNNGYAVEFVPVVCDADGNPVKDANGEYIFDNNFNVLRQIVKVPVKDAYVVVTPLENQWKNYDGLTATGIEYGFKVYTDDTKTQEITPSAKLSDYVLNNIIGELVLEDDTITDLVEPAKDTGFWFIEQGTLAAAPGAKFALEYSNPDIKFEIKPLTIYAVNNLEVEKVYDATVNAPDKEYQFTDYELKDSEGNAVQIVTSDVLKAYITGAIYDNKNVGTDKAVTFDSTNVEFFEDGEALRNYIVDAETYNNISVLGIITKRPITTLTGRIETRDYDGTDIARYLDEDKTQRLIMVQGVDALTGDLIDSDYDINTIDYLMDDELSIELLADGKYFGDDNVGTRGKDVGVNKSILFNNSSAVTSWQLIGADAGNYEYVGSLTDVDSNKADKVTYYGDIVKIIAEGNLVLSGLEAVKEYDATDVCSDLDGKVDLVRNSDGTIKTTLEFGTLAVDTIRGDVISIVDVVADGKYTEDDYTTGASNVGDHKVAFDITAFTLGGDAINYDWTDYVVKGIGTITPITVNFDTTALAQLNERTYDATNIATALEKANEGGLRNFNIIGDGILTGVKFTNLLDGEEFYIRIRTDENGEFYNGEFADKNVEASKVALWKAGTWELVEIPGNAGKIENYIFDTVDMPAIGDIIQKRITTVKFNIESRVYDATDVAYIEDLIGTDTLDADNNITETLIDSVAANLVIEEMCAGDSLSVIIKGDGTYTAGKNASAEKEALYTAWDIVGDDANNYRFSASTEPYETTPTTTVQGIGAITQKMIDKITVTNFVVTKKYDGTSRANFAQLNDAIKAKTATIVFEGMFEGDELSIEITAFGEYGSFVENVWTTSSEIGNHMVKYTRKTSSGLDRNNYYIDATDVYVENGSIT